MDKEMRIQADREFEQNEIRKLNKFMKFTILARNSAAVKLLQQNKK